MAIVMKVKELLPKLQLASKFVSDRDIVPALQYLYFKDKTLRAYNGQAGATIRVPWDFGQAGFALPAASIVKSVSAFFLAEKEDMQIELKEPGAPVTVRSGKMYSRIPSLPPEHHSAFVLRPEPPKTSRIPVDWEFWADLERVTMSVGKDETLPALRGVFWGPQGHLMSLDGKRLSLMSPLQERAWLPPNDELGLLIPDYLLQNLGEAKMDVKSLAKETNVLWFFTDDSHFWGALLEASFPGPAALDLIKGVRAKLRQPGVGTWVVLGQEGRKQLLHTLDHVLFFADSTLPTVKVFITRDTLQITTGDDPQVVEKGPGQAGDTLQVKTQGPGGEFHVSGIHLRDIIEHVSSTRFWFSGQAPLYFLEEKPSSGRPPRFEQIILLLAPPTGHSQHATSPKPTLPADESY
jgi:DNA polymerase III sliding clamp (beta) subunit (PCNA family)